MAEFVTTTGRDPAMIVASGELDLSSEEELLGHARRMLDLGAAVIDIDLGAVTFVDSSGLGALVRVHLLVTGAGRRLMLSHVPRAVTRILDLTGLADLFSERSGS